MSIFYKLVKRPQWGWRIMAAIGAAVWALAAVSWLMFADPAAAQSPHGPLPDGVELVLNCGTLQGNGTAVVRIHGRTFAILNIACARV